KIKNREDENQGRDAQPSHTAATGLHREQEIHSYEVWADESAKTRRALQAAEAVISPRVFGSNSAGFLQLSGLHPGSLRFRSRPAPERKRDSSPSEIECRT